MQRELCSLNPNRALFASLCHSGSASGLDFHLAFRAEIRRGKCSGGLRRQGGSSIRPGLQAHARGSRGSGRSGIQDPLLPEERGWLTLEFSLCIPFHVCELGLLQPMNTDEREAGGHQNCEST